MLNYNCLINNWKLYNTINMCQEQIEFELIHMVVIKIRMNMCQKQKKEIRSEEQIHNICIMRIGFRTKLKLIIKLGNQKLNMYTI